MATPSAKIISSHSPYSVSEETDLIAFYNELSSLVRSVLKHNVLVIGGDMNAQISKNINHKFGLHNSSKRNWEHLADFTLENRDKYTFTLRNKFDALLEISETPTMNDGYENFVNA